MSYISHVDYKSMMENFKKGAPKQMLKESLDPVGKEDDDINNDGKVDKTDKYLSSRRQAIGKSIGKGRMMRESDPQNDMWYEDFEDGLQNLAKNKYISPLELQYYMKALDHVDPMDNYSDFDGHDAAKEFVDDLRSKEDMQESDAGDESFDFNKSAIESATGDKISHTEMDDYDRVIYWSTKNPNVTYYIDDNDQIIKYDGETGERHAIGDLGHYDEPTHDYEPDTDADYEEPRDDFDMAGDFNDGEFWENEVKKLKEIAGVGPQDDGPEDDDEDEREAGRKKREMDDEEAENAERDEFDENAEGKLNLRDPLAAAKNVATKYKAELKPKFDEYQKSYEEYIQAIRKYDNTDPEFREITKVHNALVKAFQGNVLGLARQEMEDAGEKPVVAKNLAYGYSDEDWPSEFVTALNKELKGVAEGLHMPPLQATGQTIMTNEDQAPFGMSVLSPDERKQLKEFIESYKTIKKEIAALLEKAGKDPKIMENAKKMGDEAVPAERPAHYNDPTKTPKHKSSNLGGDRTNLVMTKAEMWEGEESVEKALGEKLHSTFNKVTQMAIKQIVADGFDPSEAVNFLKMEIEEKAKQATLGQYDF